MNEEVVDLDCGCKGKRQPSLELLLIETCKKHESLKNKLVWDFCFECGEPLTEDMEEDKDWFEVRNAGEAFPICKSCHEKAERGELPPQSWEEEEE